MRSALLQPELAADLQHNTAIDRIGNLPLLHDPFGLAQALESTGIIAAIAGELRLPEVAVQDSFVCTAQAIFKALAEQLRSLLFKAHAQRQSSASQGDTAEQRRGHHAALTQQVLDLHQQAFRTQRRASLLEPLRMIKLQQPLEQQGAVSPRQTKRLAVKGMGLIELTAQQRLLGQS